MGIARDAAQAGQRRYVLFHNYYGFIVITKEPPQRCASGKHLTSLMLNTSLGGKQKPGLLRNMQIVIMFGSSWGHCYGQKIPELLDPCRRNLVEGTRLVVDPKRIS